ncbi:alpha/beta hydrolase [Lactobacillus sp. ESL0785]|uniref:alpha/beta hydrolase fold domain-containing protein n=1 Tax=Lactobacillus sp. ESL0785 TaxID=2983232 RepID=UPI0023F95AEC|nr:alpha/beta hydrolase [Lactobacillus sp. ESL0785]WEV71013.1 alpha/beta hydrolase [Lactobacillus sp. ESL0785]
MKRKNLLQLGIGLIGGEWLQHKWGYSLSSAVIEQALRVIKPFPEVTAAKYQQALIENKAPFKLPDFAAKMGFRLWSKYSDTYCLNKYATARGRVVFYLHGGGFWQQPTYFHYAFLVKLARHLQAQIIMPIYPKIPTYNVFETEPMVLHTYQQLLETGVKPNQIVLMGDSAGGGLSLVLLEQLQKLHYQQPRQAILFSPWLDVQTNNPKMTMIQRYDHLLTAADLQLRGRLYAGKLKTDNPLVSPLYGNLTGLAPLYVFSGTHDILHVDAQRLQHRALIQKLPLQVFTYPKMAHDFVLYPIPEARLVLNQVVEIVTA